MYLALGIPRTSQAVSYALAFFQLDGFAVPAPAQARQTVRHTEKPTTDADYTHAIGQAAYCFSICEWNVDWSCEKIKPGALRKIVGDELTAGRIAKCFIDLVRNIPKSAAREDLSAVTQEFAQLVVIRNQILHGKPCTGPNGDACLSSGRVLEIVDLENAADAFSECSSKVNELLYGFLKAYVPN